MTLLRTTRRIFALGVFMAVVASMSAAHADSARGLTAIGLERTPCRAGDCPVYAVSFRADNTVVYLGGVHAPRAGNLTGRTSYDILRAAVEAQHPESLPYRSGPIDPNVSRTIVVLESGSTRRTIETTDERAAPERFKVIVATLDGAIATTSWSRAAALGKVAAPDGAGGSQAVAPHAPQNLGAPANPFILVLIVGLIIAIPTGIAAAAFRARSARNHPQS